MRGLLVAVVLAAMALLGQQRGPQGERCELEVLTTPGTVSRMVKLSDGSSRVDVTGGVEATCGEKWVRADSANYYRERGLLYLLGNVKYRDLGRTLEAERVTYYQDEDWVRSTGNAKLTDTRNGSTLTGPVLDYYPQNTNRPIERIFAPSRPHLTFIADTSGAPASEPFEVDANRMHIYSDSVVAGAGRVEAVRGELRAYGDSMHLDLAQDELWLLGDPRVEAQDMVLVGDSMLVLMDENQVREILSWPNASAQGRQLELEAPALRLFVESGEVERAVASAGDPARTGAVDTQDRAPWARSGSPEYSLTADSIDIRRPGGRVERVIAVERARAVTREPVVPADALLGRDWLEGDTITGYFTASDSAEEGSADQAQLERLIASGSARALYHLREEAETGGASNHPPVNYVIGRMVSLWLSQGEVDEAQVVGPGTGVYLEPLPPGVRDDSVAALADSTARPPSDTLRKPSGESGRS